MQRFFPFPRLAPLAPLFGLLGLTALPSAQTFLGPTPYLSRADSPFQDCVLFENFEDHLFNLLGTTANRGTVTSNFGPSLHDSVDADDGILEGSGLAGDSYFSQTPDITFTFDKNILTTYPTRVGVVWTDGAGTTSFQAFDENGVLLGGIGPVSIANGSSNGETDEDHFFGVEYDGGISAIRIWNTSGGIEIDHLQFALDNGAAVKGTETVRLGNPPNPDALRPSLGTPPILGSVWSPYVDHTTFAPSAAFDFLAVDLRGPVNVPLANGTVLCLPPPSKQLYIVPAGSPFRVNIPNNCLFAGQAACSQAGSFTPGSGLQLTGGLDVVIGSY